MRKKVLVVLLFALTIATSCTYTKIASKRKTNIWNHGPLEIVYKHGSNELNTIYHYVDNGYARDTYYLADCDKENLYKAVNNIVWSSVPDSFTTNIHSYCSGSYSSESLMIRFDNVNKSIKWQPCDLWKYDSLQVLGKFSKVLKEILFNNPVYQSLPKPKSKGYRL